jgi:ribonucleotide reductase class II
VSDFPASAPAANPVFCRTYSRKGPQGRESWQQVVERNLSGLAKLGRLNDDQVALLRKMQLEQKALPSGRWLWVGGTDWIDKPENVSGAYNCTSTDLTDWRAFALMMDLAMMGSGTGAIIEPHMVDMLPVIRNRLNVVVTGIFGQASSDPQTSVEYHTVYLDEDYTPSIDVLIEVGDSRKGWVDAYYTMFELASNASISALYGENTQVAVSVDISKVRPSGSPLKGFGGTANPVKLKDLFVKMAAIFNKAQGRKLTSVECCLLTDEAALVVVAGNVRRSASIKQFSANDTEASIAKDNLWQQDEDGNWRIDPERDALRMANHTLVYHNYPTREEIVDSVRRQYLSGEGAIMFAPEAIARSNRDILTDRQMQIDFISAYCDHKQSGAEMIKQLDPDCVEDSDKLEHRMGRYGINPCGEIQGKNFHCNLAEVHLNQLLPSDRLGQQSAFTAAALSVAALLHHKFQEPRYQYSRDLDPIVGVSFTGLFDFFVEAFGVPWLEWWTEGRPNNYVGIAYKEAEAAYLREWREIVEDVVRKYCDDHGLKCPNRMTTCQPAGTKSLLTGASPGWHPPKAQRFIRRITFRRDDPVALACLDYGYTIVPSQSDKDEQGRLLDDPFNPRCTEWLVEIPTEVSWANLPGADQIRIDQFSALAQFDFYMQVQTHYTRHNTSATIEFREHEIEPLADKIHDAIVNHKGYISAALLARFDANETFPRLPFEPIDKATYERLHEEVLQRRKGDDFFALLQAYDSGSLVEAGPAGCDSDKCLLPQAKK